MQIGRAEKDRPRIRGREKNDKTKPGSAGGTDARGRGSSLELSSLRRGKCEWRCRSSADALDLEEEGNSRVSRRGIRSDRRGGIWGESREGRGRGSSGKTRVGSADRGVFLA
ncbi:hypothetical protein ACJRO7_012407 [Eucalyptus globulus]|uniref:Uncharacterized protein n=1 Tax=Eucalyptus globulus TaxID=34317 RepID=A0ABD3LLT8_EUCGL